MPVAAIDMRLNVIALGVLAVVGILLIGGLILSIVLLGNERTRSTGIVLLAILLGLPLVGGVLLVLGVGLFRVRAAPAVPPPIQSQPPPELPSPRPLEPGDQGSDNVPRVGQLAVGQVACLPFHGSPLLTFNGGSHEPGSCWG